MRKTRQRMSKKTSDFERCEGRKQSTRKKIPKQTPPLRETKPVFSFICVQLAQQKAPSFFSHMGERVQIRLPPTKEQLWPKQSGRIVFPTNNTMQSLPATALNFSSEDMNICAIALQIIRKWKQQATWTTLPPLKLTFLPQNVLCKKLLHNYVALQFCYPGALQYT